MAKKIIDLVLEKKQKMKDSVDEAKANQVRSQAAIIGGLESVAWRNYMLHFVDPEGSDEEQEKQIMRLTATDGTEANDGLSRARAYLVANGMCGEGTRDLFESNVDGIDNGLV